MPRKPTSPRKSAKAKPAERQAVLSPQVPLRRVALLVETTRSYTRNLLLGVRRYMSENPGWSVFLELRALESPVPPWLAGWQGDGILTRSHNRHMLDAVRATGLPAVELRASRWAAPLPFVGVDNSSLGALVARHFCDRGFRHFGCYEIGTEDFFQERRDNFIATLAADGYLCHRHSAAQRAEHPAEWEQQQAELMVWLAGLPKPCGILACTDQLGFWLLDACHRADLKVPSDVAVVGVEDDESLCELSTPAMSSVHFSGARIGYEAARLLDRMMDGETAIDDIFVPPTGITVRESSDVLATGDAELSRAMQIIRARALEGISVADVADGVGISRRTLERRVAATLGRTLQQEITRVRLEAVRTMLVDTDHTLQAIAARTGFTHSQYMAQLFRETYGITPGEFRNQHGLLRQN